MKTIRVSRASFPGVGNFSWMNFFVNILSKKYNVVIDAENPELVFYTNQFYRGGELDHYTQATVRGIHEYDDNRKKIFLSGEARPDYQGHINKGNNYYGLGYEHLTHDRYLRFPTHVLDVFVLHNEGGMFNDPYSWMLEQRNADDIIAQKKHFCSIVQASNNEDRGKLFDLISKTQWIKSAGPWRQTIRDEDGLNPYKYHDYNNKEYMGRIDGLTYRDKIKFFSDTHFNIAFQYTNTDHLIQEKIVHAYAANCIPIFYGNQFINEEHFNPESFVNVHSYPNFEAVVDHLNETHSSIDKLKKYYSAPIFVNNKLPEYFNEEYILSFLDKVIQA